MNNPEFLFRQTRPHSVYLISGDEPLLVIEAQDFIRDLCKKAGFEERKKINVDKKFNWQSLQDEAMNLSLFSDKKLIELSLNAAAGREGSKAIKSFVEAGYEDLCLMIHAPNLDRNQEKAAWVKAIEADGLAIKVWPVKPHQMLDWVDNRARMMRINLSAEALSLVANYTEGNLLAAKQTLMKLQVDNKEHYSLDDVFEYISNESRYNPYELFNSAMSQPSQALRMLGNFKQEGVAPYPILWGLINEFKQLLMISSRMDSGQNFNAASADLRLWPSRKNTLQEALRIYNTRKINALLRRCEKADAAIKGAVKDDIWRLLSEIILLLGKHRIRKA